MNWFYYRIILCVVVFGCLLLGTVPGCGGDNGGHSDTENASEPIDSQASQKAANPSGDENSTMADLNQAAGDYSEPTETNQAPDADSQRDELEDEVNDLAQEQIAQPRPKVVAATLPEPTSRRVLRKFQLTDLAGHSITSESLSGHAVLVVFWATWCPPCKAEIPHLVEMQERYREDGFKILGLSLDRDGLPAVKNFVKARRNINYTIVPNGMNASHVFGRIAKIPTSILIDKDGRELKRWVGLVPEGELESWVVAAIEEDR